MSYNSYAKKIDKNQPEIVKNMRDLGAIILLDHDDILIDYCDILSLVEIKEENPFKKNGQLRSKYVKKSQYKLLETMSDNYAICWTFKQVHDFSRRIEGDYITPSKYRANLLKWRPKMTPEEKAEIQLQHWGRCL